jgi:hypothetical protein
MAGVSPKRRKQGESGRFLKRERTARNTSGKDGRSCLRRGRLAGASQAKRMAVDLTERKQTLADQDNEARWPMQNLATSLKPWNLTHIGAEALLLKPEAWAMSRLVFLQPLGRCIRSLTEESGPEAKILL